MTLYDPHVGKGDMVKFNRKTFEEDWKKHYG